MLFMGFLNDVPVPIPDVGMSGDSSAKTKSQDALYSPIEDNWYKSLPYAFIALDALDNNKEKVFNLPINPSNINITTYFATNVIATIGGTVEEHAPQRYFDISIQGTTGIAPRFTKSVNIKEIGSVTSKSRSSYLPEFSISSVTGGFFAQTAGKLDSFLNQARSIIGGNRSHESGVPNVDSGYMAFHNFYKFLMSNKNSLSSDKISQDMKKPIRFVSYKDNQEYKCAILRFTLTRSSENPMLYNYSIDLRAYSLSSIGQEVRPTPDAAMLAGLKDQNLLSTFKNKLSSAKSAVSSVTGALKTFGR